MGVGSMTIDASAGGVEHSGICGLDGRQHRGNVIADGMVAQKGLPAVADIGPCPQLQSAQP